MLTDPEELAELADELDPDPCPDCGLHDCRCDAAYDREKEEA